MAEYTYDNILINPYKEGIESLIGKEVYFSDIPNICLENANKNDISYFGILERIRKDGNNPFMVKGILSTTYWSCIIPKKEEPKPNPKYIPFENLTEFLDAYKNLKGCLNEEASYLSKNGIWLKGKISEAYRMVTEIWDSGIVIGDNNIVILESAAFNEVTLWQELLKSYTFLDGSHCGKEVK